MIFIATLDASSLATTKKFLNARYFWPSLFCDCIMVVKLCVSYHIFASKMCAPLTPLHSVITTEPFCKWDIYFMECISASVGSHKYIIVVVDYFTKWAKSMPMFSNMDLIVAHFFLNHVISHFGVPKKLVCDHGKHFENEISEDFSSLLKFWHEFATPYYP